MSRRHHGRPHHPRNRPEGPRPAPGSEPRPTTVDDARAETRPAAPSHAPETPLRGVPRALAGESIANLSPRPGASSSQGEPRPVEPPAAAAPAPDAARPSNGHARQAGPPATQTNGAPTHGPHTNGAPTNGAPTNGAAPHGPPERANNCTAPQLRRFIKSRPYVPMHELRRRFGIEGQDDDVTGVSMEVGHSIYVGLPEREGALLGELLRGGEIGYELSLDPRTPIVIGVYPMRPVPRP